MKSERYENHEKDMLKSILSKSLTSAAPSKETIAKAHENSGINSDDPLIKLKYTLLEQYQDQRLDDIEGSEIIENSSGETLKITKKEKIDFSIDKKEFENELFCDLKLIPKIGPATEKKLKEEGYKDISSLLEHEKYKEHAEEIIEKLENGSHIDKFNLIRKNCNNKGKMLKCAGDLEYDSFKFMDIETLGLSNVPIILIGIAEMDKKGKSITSTQYLLRRKVEEAAVLEGYLSHIEEDSTLITYNGASFDVPFIRNRCNYYQLNNESQPFHYDLIYYARNLWKDKLPNCKLTTIEKHIFDINRVDDVPGSHIPEFYDAYLKEDNIGPLVPIIEHNRFDIVSLAKFLNRMCEKF
ncbi:hypothetical protein MARBORIA2_13200 [Methanobrevibacter arboriphilus]|mgnify:CR=1 FL=1|jgi:uncharacterized protein YprB with RNaseH-like and TPR domain|uniref:Uncharacterized protein n=2 Tax=Methanobrevibacter arboriphilus TaxID=39441 RepID=A0ACA8R108_METAZ|nr:ribonuclease H-like domain-containing protein [Methanobrevibacter arboriphilus]MCC7561369.1 ribonuclease H-like domain-containing protein [Methanobrevibacter arboriphilus]BBL61175.1 hypothetical protein MarbSA_02150 [Methanobrevibacter arboriphilus]GLI12230.1 hypothetical protein MARBORIA2_13200 [Methanobrevibacter arboriphilus]